MVTGTVVVVVEIGAGETAGSAAGSIAVGVSGVTVIVTGTVIGMVVVVPVVVMHPVTIFQSLHLLPRNQLIMSLNLLPLKPEALPPP